MGIYQTDGISERLVENIKTYFNLISADFKTPVLCSSNKPMSEIDPSV